MFYTVYQITNKINNKTYVGKHQTENLNDGYMGSGRLIKRAIKKHGIENFDKQILFVYDNEQEMNDKEKELVILSEETYNLCPGGQGGFGYINSKLMTTELRSEYGRKGGVVTQLGIRCRDGKLGIFNPKYDDVRSLWSKGNKSFSGRKHSEESRRKISLAMRARKNKQVLE